ncbi:PD-(D/E)XK nuclease family protein [Saccharothrix algeriensis]|uniref:PD-(D/E)XK endonuclease-like domain-containing protein n=2 Tax=Catellatospora bangladeshensis TaxID=310355 RepID=A0A8J3JRP5_9ACTN|nr:hypothetical protein Cba03nite_39130 [Catellatospora bangladeshensis]
MSRTPTPSGRRTGRGKDVPEQLGFDLMPERLFVCTPSKLTAYADCPRRYRHAYVDRPAPPKGPAWAHNSLGASVHTALRNWWDVPVERRGPEALPRLLRATWVREGYRDDEQERAVYDRALGWLESYVAGLDPEQSPLGVERTVAAKTSVLALSGRADRIDARDGEAVIVDYKTGRTGLDADDARGSLALALYAFAAERVFRRRCRTVELHHLPTGTVAAHEHTPESIARHVSRAEDTARDIMAAERALDEGADPDEAFPTNPGALCSWCDYRRVCPAGADAPNRDPWAAIESTVPTAVPHQQHPDAAPSPTTP